MQGLLNVLFGFAAIKVFLLVRLNDKTMFFMIVSLGTAGLCKYTYQTINLFYHIVNLVFFALNSA
jgi:hypothetical protein